MSQQNLQMESVSFNQHHNSDDKYTDTWLTPPEIIKSVGQFDLDPCAALNMPWETATTMWTIEDDGLSKEWYGRVWCNPPYSDVVPWFKRMAQHGNGIVLTFARTETAYYHEYVWGVADAIFFFDGRLTFCKENGMKAKNNAGAPSVLIAYGENNAEELRRCKLRGQYIQL